MRKITISNGVAKTNTVCCSKNWTNFWNLDKQKEPLNCNECIQFLSFINAQTTLFRVIFTITCTNWHTPAFEFRSHGWNICFVSLAISSSQSTKLVEWSETEWDKAIEMNESESERAWRKKSEKKNLERHGEMQWNWKCIEHFVKWDALSYMRNECCRYAVATLSVCMSIYGVFSNKTMCAMCSRIVAYNHINYNHFT